MSNDVKVAKEQVAISFRQREYVPPKYVFEMDDRADMDQMMLGAVRIRKYPAYPPGSWSPVGTPMRFDQGIKVVVTEGTITATTEVRERECYGTAVVSGDSEFALPYPVIHDLSFSIDGQMYDVRGREITVNVAFSSTKNALIFSRPCYGVVRYSFFTQYMILRYFPAIYNDIEAYYMPDPKDYGELLGFIEVPAIIDPISPVVFSITPPQGIAAEFELYRVESVALANEAGLWEKPMGWPGSGTYEGYIGATQAIDPNGSYVEIARTHEIGYFSLFNQQRRMEGYQSSATESLPLDYSKETRLESQAGKQTILGSQSSTTSSDGSRTAQASWNVIQVQKKEYFDKYRRLLNNAPAMRTVHYDVPIAEPFKTASAINAVRETSRILSGAYASTTDAQGQTTRRQTVTEALNSFKIKLVIKAPSRPSVSTAMLRNQSNKDSTDLDTQALRVNTMLSLIWEGVDWSLLRKKIRASYDADIYQITFDSSFPSN